MHYLFLLVLMALVAGPAIAQPGYPAKPVRVVVPFPPGASNDIIARAVTQKLGDALAQSFVVDNRGGAGGSIGAAITARAPADGYTLMVTSTTYTTSAAVQTDLPFDPLKDVSGIAMIGSAPMLIVAATSLPAQSLKELVALAREKPGYVNYASSGIGSAPHLATELFLSHAGTRMEHVPYKGLGPAMPDLLAGRVHVLIASMPSTLPHVQANRVRGLAVTSRERSRFAPEIPTATEAGVSGYTSELWWGLFAPAGLPEAVTQRLHREVSQVVAGDDIVQLLAKSGAEPANVSVAAFNRLIRDDIEKWTKIVKSAGIKAR
jgi:tripartite-type tricarboxylate transporter receptor subunit TctC